MTNELMTLIQSYPDHYSAKEISALIWAETGLLVSQTTILEVLTNKGNPSLALQIMIRE